MRGLLTLLLFGLVAFADDEATKSVNKLKYLYYFSYLPFNLEFIEGKTVNEIYPVVMEDNNPRLVKNKELQKIDEYWAGIKQNYQTKSLLLKTPIKTGETVRISPKLVSHMIPPVKGCLEVLPVSEQIEWKHLIEKKTGEQKALFKQVAFLQKFIERQDEGRFNFFMIGTNWCESCKEYRVLFESYLKQFPKENFTLHNLIINDPKEQIFDFPLLKELFPHPEKYTHESIPMFITFEMQGKKPVVYEEGEALQYVYEKYFKENRGFLRPTETKPQGPSQNLLRSLGSVELR